ncbi:MAG: hypothetical protein ACJAX5_000015 [Patiriisocius sp.]|jgi:hypothetical protein
MASRKWRPIISPPETFTDDSENFAFTKLPISNYDSYDTGLLLEMAEAYPHAALALASRYLADGDADAAEPWMIKSATLHTLPSLRRSPMCIKGIACSNLKTSPMALVQADLRGVEIYHQLRLGEKKQDLGDLVADKPDAFQNFWRSFRENETKDKSANQ